MTISLQRFEMNTSYGSRCNKESLNDNLLSCIPSASGKTKAPLRIGAGTQTQVHFTGSNKVWNYWACLPLEWNIVVKTVIDHSRLRF